jgi:hypothetical protein
MSVNAPTHLEMNFKAHSTSPLKRTKNPIPSALNPFQWVFAMSLEIHFKAGVGHIPIAPLTRIAIVDAAVAGEGGERPNPTVHP